MSADASNVEASRSRPVVGRRTCAKRHSFAKRTRLARIYPRDKMESDAPSEMKIGEIPIWVWVVIGTLVLIIVVVIVYALVQKSKLNPCQVNLKLCEAGNPFMGDAPSGRP